MALTRTRYEILKKIITEEITSVKKEIDSIKERIKSIQTEAINPIAHGPGEEGPQANDYDIAVAQLNRFTIRLNALQNVGIRLRTNRYTDRCGCGSTISWDRIQAIPETERCVDCAGR